MAKGGVTITELALRAGVSAATVSIVLNRKPLARRVPEHTLLAVTFAGGGVGALLGMRVFHHKTRKT